MNRKVLLRWWKAGLQPAASGSAEMWQKRWVVGKTIRTNKTKRSSCKMLNNNPVFVQRVSIHTVVFKCLYFLSFFYHCFEETVNLALKSNPGFVSWYGAESLDLLYFLRRKAVSPMFTHMQNILKLNIQNEVQFLLLFKCVIDQEENEIFLIWSEWSWLCYISCDVISSW